MVGEGVLAQVHFLALLDELPILGGGREHHVGRGVQARLAGILDNADDETDADNLHGNIVADAEQRAAHGDEQKCPAGHARRAAGGHGGQHAQDDGRDRVDRQIDGLAGGHGHDRDGDRRAGHVDSGAQRDGHRVVVLVQAELAAQLHVHRYVGGRAAGEEGGEAGILQAAQDERIGVLAGADPHDERVGDQRDDEHAGHEHQDEMAVLGEDLQARGADRGVHQAEDAEGSQIDDPAHRLGNGVGDGGEHFLGALAGSAQGDAEHHGPGEDAHVVGVHEGVDGVGHDVHEQRGEHLPNALGGRLLNHGRGVEGKRGRENLATDESHDSRHKRADDVEHDDGFHGTGTLGIAKGADDQEEHEHGGDGLQRADEQRAQKRDDVGPRLHIRNEQRQDDANGEADENALDEADLVVLPKYCGDCQGDSPFLARARTSTRIPAARSRQDSNGNGAGERT